MRVDGSARGSITPILTKMGRYDMHGESVWRHRTSQRRARTIVSCHKTIVGRLTFGFNPFTRHGGDTKENNGGVMTITRHRRAKRTDGNED